ncbi:hypothetical protein [Bdellovibrio svalbardensis]|uniref:Uncharacterized protein n=1 Tax=Bdellovibrio svalbardensis TaxID=2972972 RepID=A0ABT6DLS3_9BACT|nr:hypothetical protein [Bdellovibrio svalbardensis]MDG0816766.1 hypothetical protein [Bdellovibrio svalbardensis]
MTNSFVELLGKIANSILTSLIVSIVLFVAGYSVLTGEFPPNLAKLKKSYQNLHKVTQISRQIHEQDLRMKKQYEKTGQVSEEDVAVLQSLNLQRAELGVGILAGDSKSDQTNERIQQLEKRVTQLETELKSRNSK